MKISHHSTPQLRLFNNPSCRNSALRLKRAAAAVTGSPREWIAVNARLYAFLIPHASRDSYTICILPQRRQLLSCRFLVLRNYYTPLPACISQPHARERGRGREKSELSRATLAACYLQQLVPSSGGLICIVSDTR